MTAKPLIALPAGWALVRLSSTDSTNAQLRARAIAGAPEGTVVWADEQTAGRGRQERDWKSGGVNLLFSVLARPDCDLAAAGQLSFMSAVAMGEAVERVAPSVRLQCKWPNDLLGTHGKLCGILLEGCGIRDGDRIDGVVVGIGLNMDWKPEGETLYPASSLAREGAATTREAVLEAFLGRFAAWLECWRAEGFGPLREAWLARARGLGGPVTVRLPGETVHGTFETLDADGALVLSGLPEGKRLIHAGDVFFG
jgi:BirA family biotin operon repressor/biotin-[acetyl-CoA-carboxylase] ligase